MQSESNAPPGVRRLWKGAASYAQAVEEAGITELPAPPRDLDADLARGRWQDDDPPGVSR